MASFEFGAWQLHLAAVFDSSQLASVNKVAPLTNETTLSWFFLQEHDTEN